MFFSSEWFTVNWLPVDVHWGFQDSSPGLPQFLQAAYGHLISMRDPESEFVKSELIFGGAQFGRAQLSACLLSVCHSLHESLLHHPIPYHLRTLYIKNRRIWLGEFPTRRTWVFTGN